MQSVKTMNSTIESYGMMCVFSIPIHRGGLKPIEHTFQPIPLHDFVALATTVDLPIRGLQSRITKFLDDQVRRYLPGGMVSNLIWRM